MKSNIIKKITITIYLISIFVVIFFVAPQNILAADCVVKQATFSPSGTQAESWYLDSNKPDVTINISTANCEGKTIDVSVAEEDWGIANDDDLSNSGLDEKPIVVPTSNSVTIHLKAGEEECEKYGTIGDDCEYIIYVDNPDTGTYSSDDKPNGNLRYECDVLCEDNWVIDTINLPANLPPTSRLTNIDTNYTPLVSLPGLEKFDTASSKENPCPFGNYLNIIIKLVIGIAAVLAMVMIVMGGVEYMTSELVSGKEAGKETIQHAILGLMIALGAYLILNTINPQLLSACLDKLPEASITIDPEPETAPQTGYYQVTGNTGNCKEGYADVNVSTPGNPNKINVCKTISTPLGNMITKAKEGGIILSGSGSRSYDTQVKLRKEHGCPDIYNSPSTACHPQTARPGHSQHESGKAVDFNCNGQSMGNSSCFNWLKTNASAYGFFNLPSEPWHWSVNGH